MNHVARIRKILVIVDPGEEVQLAVDRGEQLARALGASLELFTCGYMSSLETDHFLEEERLEKARRACMREWATRLESRAASLRERDVEVVTDVAWKRPLHDGILHKVAASQPDLVIKQTAYHSPLKRALFTNTDWQLIRECPVPLLLVKLATWKEPGAIIAAVDPLHTRDKPADLDHRILETMSSLAEAMSWTPWALHCWTGDAFDVEPEESERLSLEGYDTAHRERLRELVQKYPAVTADHVIAARGRVEDELCDKAADVGANITVMGAVSRSVIRQWILGNTAEKVLDRIGTDVLVVKPDDTRIRDRGEEEE